MKQPFGELLFGKGTQSANERVLMRNDRGMAEIKQSVSSKYRSKLELTGGKR